MRRLLSIFFISFIFQSCGTETSSLESSASTKSSGSCFGGWISDRKNTDPTGFCKGTSGSMEFSTRIEVDYHSQRLYIHGSVKDLENGTTKWLSRRFDVESCQDVTGGRTEVDGISSSNEKYNLSYREIREIPSTGHAQQAFEGEAKLSIELDGESHKIDLSCVRYIF